MKSISILFILPLFLINLAQSQVFQENYTYSESQVYSKSDSLYDKKGEAYTGEYKEHFPGIIKVRGFYKDGLKHGEFKEYYPDGNLFKVTNWKDGQLDGESTLYGVDDAVKSKEYFSSGLKHGECLYFYLGMLDRVIRYSKGNKVDSLIYDLGNEPYSLTVLLPNEISPLQYKKEVEKNEMLSLDSIFLTPVGVPFFEDNPENQIIKLSTLKIVSFSCSGAQYYKKGRSRSGLWMAGSENGKIDKDVLEGFFSSYPREFSVFQIVVENMDGYQWEIPSRTWKILKDKSE